MARISRDQGSRAGNYGAEERVIREAVIANPKAKLLDQVREEMRLRQLIRLVPTTLTLPGFRCC